MLPNCVVIGAARSGTTSLYEYLNAHPEVFMSPVKEPDFFVNPLLNAVHCPEPGVTRTPEEETALKAELKQELGKYESLFDGAGNARIRGEASAHYLGDPTAAMHLRRYVPDARLICVLRDPAQRMHSHFIHHMRVFSDFGSTEEELQKLTAQFYETVDRAYAEGYSHPATNDAEVWVRTGFYHQHLTRFQSLFPAEQMKVFLFEDLSSDAQGLMTSVYGFLGVDDTFVLPTTEAFNASVVPKNQAVFRFFTRNNPVMQVARSMAPAWLRGAAMHTRNKVLAGSKPAEDDEVRRKLIHVYREDILQLQDLIGRDLSAWLDESGAASKGG
ncbi:MAG TPA: sulfotransferase [Armatimonadaceae bacterium]|nr:sulfotransferase [Armatimonadaceae bacterium]